MRTICLMAVVLIGTGADGVAKKTGTDVATARKCIDQWRRTMKGGAHP